MFFGAFSTGSFNPLRYSNDVDCYKLKALADNDSNMAYTMKFSFDRFENIVGKEENAGNQHFLLLPQCFQKPSILTSIKLRIMW